MRRSSNASKLAPSASPWWGSPVITETAGAVAAGGFFRHNRDQQPGMAKTVDQWMEEADVTVEELAERSDLEPRRVEAIAMGRWLASPQERQRIAAVFKLSVDDILWGHVMSPRNVRYHRFGLKEDFQ